MKLSKRHRLTSILLGLVAVLFIGTSPAAELRDDGPLALVISYHTAPANRLAFRQQLQGSALHQFQHWTEQGILKSYRILFGRHVDSDGWDALALLSFADYADLERWKYIEQHAPAGLAPRSLALTTAIETAPADLVRSSGFADLNDKAEFLVVPYEVLVPTDEYLAYIDGYLIPQLRGWLDVGALTGYGLYLPRYSAGRAWSSLLVLEYKNDEALGEREAIAKQVRAHLQDIPEWNAISDSKKKVRVEKQATLADPITFH